MVPRTAKSLETLFEESFEVADKVLPTMLKSLIALSTTNGALQISQTPASSDDSTLMIAPHFGHFASTNDIAFTILSTNSATHSKTPLIIKITPIIYYHGFRK